jgi:peptidyl-prolyl cis-trans isomerase D
MAYLNCLISLPLAPEVSRLSQIGAGLLPLLLIFTAVALWILYIRSLQRALERCSGVSRATSPDAVWLLLVPAFSAAWHFFVVSRLAKSLGSEFRDRNLPDAGPAPGKRVGMAMCLLPLISVGVFAAGSVAVAHYSATGVLVVSLKGVWLASALAGLICWFSYWMRIESCSRALAKPLKGDASAAPSPAPRPSFPYFPIGIAGLAVSLALTLPSAVGFLVFEASGRAAESAGAYAAIYPHWYSAYLFSGRYVSHERVSQIARQQVQRQYPQYANNPAIQGLIEQQVGQHLVQQQILLIEAQKLGIRATAADVDQLKHEGQIGHALYPDGQYIGDERYAELISEHFNLSVKEFEEELRRNIVITRLEALITASVAVGDAEVREIYRQRTTRIKFDYAVISARDLRQTINPSDRDLEAFFSKNAARYATAVPEQRRIAYFAFTGEQIPGGVAQPSQQEIQQYFAAHQSDYAVPEQARSRHILIMARRGADPATDAKSRAKAEGLLSQIQGGANFADLARKFSEDPGSKDKGGELGFAWRGMMVPEFDNAIFTQKIGETRMVKTQFGYHIVQVEERQAAQSKPLSEVQPAIQAVLVRQIAAAAEEGYAQALASEAAKNGLEKTAAAHHLQVATTPLVGVRGFISGFADPSQLLAKAFQSKQGDPPQYVPTGEGYAIFQVAAIAPPHAPNFADWKSQVAEDYRSAQLPVLLGQKTQELAAKAKAENDLAKAAKEAGATLETSDLMGFSGQAPDLGPVGQAAPQLFDLSVGEISGPISTPRVGVVARILDKQEPSPEEMARNLGQAREQILDQRRGEAFSVFLNNLSSDFKKHNLVHLKAKAKGEAMGEEAPAK